MEDIIGQSENVLETLSQRLQEKCVECSSVSPDYLIMKNCFLQRNLFRCHLKCEEQWLLLFNGAACSVERHNNINHLEGHRDEDMLMIEDFLIRYSNYIESFEKR